MASLGGVLFPSQHEVLHVLHVRVEANLSVDIEAVEGPSYVSSEMRTEENVVARALTLEMT